MRLSEERKVESMAFSAQLQQKNDRIQLVKSRHKIDKEKLEHATKATGHLEKELEEKNSKSKTFENSVRTLSDKTKLELESMAAEVKDLQSKSIERIK